MSRRVGGAFKVGHDLEGKHLALTKDRKIVQTWRANNWEKGHYSKATFRLAKAAGGTRVAQAVRHCGAQDADACLATKRGTVFGTLRR